MQHYKSEQHWDIHGNPLECSVIFTASGSTVKKVWDDHSNSTNNWQDELESISLHYVIRLY